VTKLPLPNGATVHFVGIGGSGMSSLAMLLARAGYRVTGSDLASSPVTESLQAAGVAVALGHDAPNVEAADLVVRSSAVPETNVEVAAARARGIRVLKHSDLIGTLSETHRTLAVAGTHGKTTTTAMLAFILIHADLDPIALIGGVVPRLGSGAYLGSGDIFVVEADEFDRRFLALQPEVAIVTNVEPDHLDYYGSYAAVKAAFASFTDRVPDHGWLVLNADYPDSLALADRRPDQSVLYGLTDLADWRAAGVTPNDRGGNDFVVYARDALIAQFRLQVPGRHNVSNALAAAVAAGRIGVDFTTASAALEAFTGVDRRLEVKGRAGGVTVIDDYAHHPTKVRASLAALREQHAGRIVCLFQPHHYHRLSSLFDDFAAAFADADVVVLTDVYAPAGRGPAAGERTGRELAKAIDENKSRYAGPLARAIDEVVSLLRAGDVVITMGAGDVTTAGPALLERLRSRGPS
jgi:UDP-N-acetylmuramate--alanine ligase